MWYPVALCSEKKSWVICRRKLQIVPENYSYKYQLIALYMSYITLKTSKSFIKRKILVVLGLIKQKVFLKAF